MTNAKLKEALELKQLIGVTKDAILELSMIKSKSRDLERIYDDKVYNLSIGKYKDGSGICANLNRYYGNYDLMNCIVIELERQLEDFKKKYKEL